MREEEAHEQAVIQAGNQCPPWVPLGPRRHPEPDCQREPLPPLSPRVWSRLARSRLCAAHSCQRGDIGVEMDTDTRSVSCGGTVTRCTENLGVYLGVNLLGMRSRESQEEENRGDSSGCPARHRKETAGNRLLPTLCVPVRSGEGSVDSWTAWAPGWLLSRSCLAPRGSHSKSDDGGR